MAVFFLIEIGAITNLLDWVWLREEYGPYPMIVVVCMLIAIFIVAMLALVLSLILDYKENK